MTTAAEPVPAVAATSSPTLPVEVTFYRPRPLQIILVGAGGTGARMAPDIARLLNRGDSLIIVDPDTVEEKNLIRQHFVRPDVGRYKAEVVAQRATIAAAPGVVVDTKVMKLENIGSIQPLVDA